MIDKIKELFNGFESLTTDEKVAIINNVKLFLHSISPMKTEPVDCVLWVKNNLVAANDYNPN